MTEVELRAIMATLIFTLGEPAEEGTCPYSEAVADADAILEHVIEEFDCPAIAPPKEGLAN